MSVVNPLLQVQASPSSRHTPDAVALQKANYVQAVSLAVHYDSGDSTLRRIYEAANEDVEMKDAFTTETLFLVPDTNVLIDHLDVMKRFNEDIEALGLPIMIVIPNVLLNELDGLKKREQVGWFASRASTWILDRMKERRTVKVQARRETCYTEGVPFERKNDTAICDCCRFFRQKGPVVLLSNDTNLCIDTFREDIPAIKPSKRGWSSRDLAQSLAIHGVDITKFRGHDNLSIYRPATGRRQIRVTVVPVPDDTSEDRMEVDDGNVQHEAENTTEEYIPSHALDSLHLQVIDHFTLVLKDLALRVRTVSGDVGPPAQSSHAPGYRRKEFAEWTVGDSLDYLGSKKPLRPSSPSLRVFLLRPYTDRGSRRGQDWSRRDWENSIAALQDMGLKFEDSSVLGSLEYLKVETERVFRTPLRPTGL